MEEVRAFVIDGKLIVSPEDFERITTQNMAIGSNGRLTNVVDLSFKILNRGDLDQPYTLHSGPM